MVGKNQIKRITSLQQKKFRKASGQFIAEGKKVISELLEAGFELESLYVTSDIFRDIPPTRRFETTEDVLRKMSALATANDCLAVFRMKEPKSVDWVGLTVVLDDVRDPGNLGTIIRLCDWFGVESLVCSPESADLYNPKVVQATMGSLARVNVQYLPLDEILQNVQMPVYGTVMDGENVYRSSLPENAILVMGNEASGISPEVEKYCTRRISIPRFGDLQKTESLNVATATAVFLSEFRRGK